MKISAILREKGGDVVTMDSRNSLLEASGVLRKNRIGSAVAIDSDDRIVGVLSERDIVRCIAEQGVSALELRVEQAMTQDVITASPDMSLEDGLACMTSRRIRHLPVLEDGNLVGIVSIGDLVKFKIAMTEAEAEAMKQYIHAG